MNKKVIAKFNSEDLDLNVTAYGNKAAISMFFPNQLSAKHAVYLVSLSKTELNQLGNTLLNASTCIEEVKPQGSGNQPDPQL